ncbi:MAG: hypothetical protein LAO78_21605 [Acidobacteriia bacterium]|nr:hypothetical protein [Terriglobia bacterium]
MATFPAFLRNFQMYPQKGAAYEFLSPLLGQLKQVDFVLRVANPLANQGQMDSNLDESLKNAILALGASPVHLPLPPGVPQKLDFAFKYADQTVAVEIEKANREKILRDILKCHMYFHSYANFAIVALPKNYPHLHGVWDLFDFGKQRFDECNTYGFGTAGNLGRILLLGFQQFDASTNEPLSVETRQRMRAHASGR